MKKIIFLGGASWLAISAVSPAAAQTATPTASNASSAEASAPTSSAAPEAPTPGADANGNSGGIQDIVVTAQRREERLQRVPITVTVLGGGLIARSGLADTSDLNIAVPNLQMSQQQNGVTPFIRGVGTALVAQGNEPSVATYVDGFYYPSAVGAWFDFNNIERIEVLAGPQGTLFGRNATGGVIQVVTKDPSHVTSGQVSAGYGNYSTVTSTGYITGGLTNNLAADLAYSVRNQDDGWGHDLSNGNKAYYRNDAAVRGKLLWTTDAFEVRASADYDRVGSDLGIASSFLPGAVGDDGVTTYRGFFATQTNPSNHYVIHQGGATLNISHEFDWGGKVVSLTSFRKITSFTIYDEDSTPVDIIGTKISNSETTWTQEFQLLSAPKSAVQWTAGLYFFHDSALYDPLYLQGAGLGGLPYLNYMTDTGAVSYSGYGQATIPLLTNLRATLGGRFTSDKRTISGAEDLGGSFVGYVDPVSGNLTPGYFKNSKTFSKFTYKAGLDYQLAPDTLMYGSASRGFKSGIFNSIQFTTPAVQPEVLNAYEVGVKSTLLDRHLVIDLSGFYYDYKDIQLFRSVQGAVATFNATSAKIKGVDLQLTVAPLPRLTFNGGVSYLDGHYGTFLNAPVSTPNPNGGNTVAIGSVSGNATIHSPHWKGNITGSYTVPLGAGRLELSGTYSYTGSFFWDPDNRNRQTAYNIVNANATLVSSGDVWRLSVWGKNLNNAHYYGYVTSGQDGDIGAPEAPRTYGFTVSRKF